MPTLESNLRKGCLLLDMIRRKFSGYGEASTLSVRHLYSRIGWINLIQGSEWANKRKIGSINSKRHDRFDLTLRSKVRSDSSEAKGQHYSIFLVVHYFAVNLNFFRSRVNYRMLMLLGHTALSKG